MAQIRLEPPYAHALVLLRHRLVADQLEANRRKIAAVAAACLHPEQRSARDCDLDKQEAPGAPTPKASTDRNPVQESHGGRFHHGSA